MPAVEEATSLGFDVEYKPNFKRGPNNPPALIHWLLQIKLFVSPIPNPKLGPLVDILENPDIIKTGVAIKDDLVNLKKIDDFTPSGFEDLASLAQSLKSSKRITKPAIFCKQRLSKSLPNFQIGKRPLPSQLIMLPLTLGL